MPKRKGRRLSTASPALKELKTAPKHHAHINTLIRSNKHVELINFLEAPHQKTDEEKQANATSTNTKSVEYQPWENTVQGATLWHHAIVLAAANGKTDSLLALLMHIPDGASAALWALPCPGETEGWTLSHQAVYLAAANGKTDSLLALLMHKPDGASVALWALPCPGKPKGRTLSHEAVCHAVCNDKTDTICALLMHKPDGASAALWALLCPGETEGWTLLHEAVYHAARSSKKDTLSALLKLNPDNFTEYFAIIRSSIYKTTNAAMTKRQPDEKRAILAPQSTGAQDEKVAAAPEAQRSLSP